MDTATVIAELEESLAAQLRLVGDESAVDRAGQALLAALGPALRQAALALAEQAAAEVDGQLPEARVEVTLRDGEPTLRVHVDPQDPVSFRTDELVARLTVRLPQSLKHELDRAARAAGESINSYVVKALSDRRPGRNSHGSHRRIQGTFET